jgi:hypothetical protein
MSAIADYSNYIHATYKGFQADSSYNGITLENAETAVYKTMRARFKKAAWNQISIKDPETFKQWEKDSRQKDRIINQILNSIGKGAERGYAEIFNQYKEMVENIVSQLKTGLYQTDMNIKAASIDKTISLLNDWYSVLHKKEKMSVFTSDNGKIVLGPDSGGVLNASSLQSVAKAINSLIDRSNGIGKALSAESVSSSLSSVLGANIGEAAGGYAMAQACSHGLEEANNYFQSLGAKNVQIDTKELQELQKRFGQRGGQRYKADISYNNIKTQFKVNNETIQVTVEIPSTVKSYVFSDINRLHLENGTSSGGRIGQALLSLKSLSKKHVLYAYNILATADQNGNNGVEDIRNIVATGMADQLLSGFGFGTNDTALLLLSSGRIYNVYELLLNKETANKITVTFDLTTVREKQAERRAAIPNHAEALIGSQAVYTALDNANFSAHLALGKILPIKS